MPYPAPLFISPACQCRAGCRAASRGKGLSSSDSTLYELKVMIAAEPSAPLPRRATKLGDPPVYPSRGRDQGREPSPQGRDLAGRLRQSGRPFSYRDPMVGCWPNYAHMAQR
jgi:hypothetical protein